MTIFELREVSRIWTCRPNSNILATFGLRPNHFSNGVLSLHVVLAVRFNMKTAVDTASAHKSEGRPLPVNIVLAASMTVRFERSATSFCCGVYGAGL